VRRFPSDHNSNSYPITSNTNWIRKNGQWRKQDIIVETGQYPKKNMRKYLGDKTNEITSNW
jgi:hypothetical protein